MQKLLNRLFENHFFIFKIFIYIVSVVAIVYLFPRGGQFKYQFQKGKVWNYEDFYAPFDFAIPKTEEAILSEKNALINQKSHFFVIQDSVKNWVTLNLENRLSQYFDSQVINHPEYPKAHLLAKRIIENIYQKGLVDNQYETQNILNNYVTITLLKGNKASYVFSNQLFTLKKRDAYITQMFENMGSENFKKKWIDFLRNEIVPNIFYDSNYTNQFFDSQLASILPLKGFIPKGTKIIAKGDFIEANQFEMLTAINKEFDNLTWSKSNFYWLLFSYSVLIGLALLLLILFINRYRPDVGENTAKVSFLFFNIFLMILTTTLILKYYPKFLYIVPYALLPLLIKAFLDPRIGLFTHVLTVLLLGFMVPNSFEFIFIQIMAGIITILTVSELNKRANLFWSVAKITGVYLLTYLAFTITHEGSMTHIDKMTIYLFGLNGLITASLIIPLIFVYEKMFGLVSDETLREYSDSNHPILRELNEKAPGTFQHSIQVANLAEAGAKEINANALLARTGALYHDIGKIFNPMYFVENQSTHVNPHNELEPEESASIIINHVSLGVELAKKHKLPDRLIDFIRTHHGTNLVYYFYKKEETFNPETTNINKFTYPGPLPFSKETAIVMICDATEAASKSLKEPTAKTIDLFVDKIVKGQIENGQFQNANITFREIEKVKKVVKKKLKNIYHIRIEYPD